MTKLEREYNEIWQQLGWTARQRIDAALKFPISRRPGAVRVRERQRQLQEKVNVIHAKLRHTPFNVLKWKADKEYKRRNSLECRIKGSGDQDFGRLMAYSYHHHIHKLFTSSYAYIVYGSGGQSETSWGVYNRSYGYPARWKNAGYKIFYKNNNPFVILENNYGRQVITLPLPPKKVRDRYVFDSDILLDGDLYGITKHDGVIERFGLSGDYSISTGFAVRLYIDGKPYWEHGKTIKDIKAEYKHKLAIAKKNAEKQVEEKRQNRKIALVMHLCKNMKVTREHARSLGYCQAGIDAFCTKYGLGLGTGLALAGDIMKTNDKMAIEAVRVAARELLQARPN